MGSASATRCSSHRQARRPGTATASRAPGRSIAAWSRLLGAALFVAGGGPGPVLAQGTADSAASSPAPQTALPKVAVTRVDGALLVEFDRAVPRGPGELALWLDRRDVTSLARRQGPQRWLLPAEALALLGPVNRVELWWVQGDGWMPIDQRDLSLGTAASAAGAGSAQPPQGWKPRIDLALKAQLHAEASGITPLPRRHSWLDTSVRAGIAVDQALADQRLRGSLQLAGTSYRPEALQYATRGQRAELLDLAEYRFDLGSQGFTISAGHQGVGQHPLLLDRFASRGVSGQLRGSGGWDVAVAMVNGSAIVGYANPLGVDDDEHRIHLVTAGQELLPAQPGRLRLELSWMDAAQRALGSFNQGQVPDAERIRGLGLRLGSRLLDDRLRADLTIGRLHHQAADDPQLVAGSGSAGPAAPLTPLAGRTREAWRAELGFDLLRGWTGLAERLPLTVTVQWRRSRVQPLYKTVGTFLAADRDLEHLALSLSAGQAQLALSTERWRDNLDRLPTLLTTRTSNDTVALSLPAATWSAAPAPAWLPALTLQHTANAQRALDAPDFALTGLAASHRPDQSNRSTQLQAAWTLQRAMWSLSAQRGRQDNRQSGRENADFTVRGFGSQLSLPLGESISTVFAVNSQRNHSHERHLTDAQDSATLGLDWRAGVWWSLSWQLALQRGRDASGQLPTRARSLQTQLTRRFELDQGGLKLPGQWFVRHAWADTRRAEGVAGAAGEGLSWSVQAGLGLSWGTP